MEGLSILRSRRGEFAFRCAVGAMIAALVLSAAFSILCVYHAVGTVRENVNEAVLAVAAVNVSEFFGGSRETDGYARHPDSGGFSVSLDAEDVRTTLARAIGGTVGRDGSITVEDAYVIRDLNTVYQNTDGSVLCFTTTLTVIVPLKLGGISVPIQKMLEVSSRYDAKF